MKSSVSKKLRENYVDNSPFHTHVSMVAPKGRYQISGQTTEDFWDIYCEEVNEGNTILGVAEKPGPYLPVLADIDIKCEVSDDEILEEHLYSEDQILQVISVYQSVLRNIVEDCRDYKLLCVVLEKPIYLIHAREKTYAKNGFHLHFPNLFLSRQEQEIHLIPRVKKELQGLDTFKSLGFENSGDVIDKCCCNVPWLMLGSRKSADMDPYSVTRVIDSEGSEISAEKAFANYKLLDSHECELDITGRIDYYMPRILSIFHNGRNISELRNGLISPVKKIMREKEKKENKKKFAKVTASENLKISSRLLEMIGDWRAEDRNEWIRIGWVLYNIGEGCTEALDQWLAFSSRCEEKYDETSCIFQWQRMVKKDFTLGTLYEFAKTDSPEKYAEYKKEKTMQHISNSVKEGSHNDIAKALHAQFGDEFVCASITGKVWYQYRSPIWEEVEEGTTLRARISETIVKHYQDMAQKEIQQMGQGEDKSDAMQTQNRMKKIMKMIVNLKSAPYKNNVMKEAMEVFYNRKFKSKLNQNPYLIAFKNGVYDLKNNIFRQGLAEDYISKNIPIDYQEYNESDEAVQNVIEFLQKIFPDKSIRTYFLDTYSDIFVGGNPQKKVYLWTGDGDNGKSITQTFFEKMLGELAIKFNTQYFTGKKTSTGSANPELARAAPPVRHVTMEEPDADEQLNIGELKKLSGGDSYWARDLFEKGKNTREVFPQFTLTFICNELPKLKYSDRATWNRLRVIPFETTFVEPGKPCPETFEEQLLLKQFPMDKSFGAKIPKMVPAFAWYLLEWRKKVTVRIEPEKVKEATAHYRRQNDIYRQFIEECIVEDRSTSLPLTELYSQFKEWFKEGWSGMSVPIKNEVKDYFYKLWGDPERGCRWKGYRVRTLEEEIANGDAIVLDEEDLAEGGNNMSDMI
jgi:P4 family phage/plasmid primase-like protien